MGCRSLSLLKLERGILNKCLLGLLLLALISIPEAIFPQSLSLRGQATDQSGAFISAATVTISGPSGLSRTTTTDSGGRYVFTDLIPGEYLLQASAPKLMLAEPVRIALVSGDQLLNLQLKVVLEEKVTVEEYAARVNLESSSNVSAVIISGSDLDALADNPEDLQSDLQALAGPGAGPGGGSVFVDGFSGGQLPSKESIREIRINQNPFSAEYDKLGLGRIEILTKPGTDKFRGSGYYNFADDFWNSRNPYAQQKAPFQLKEYGGSVSGPVNKRSSFFLDVRRDSVDNGSIINAITLDPVTLEVVNPYTATPGTPQRRIGINPRIDYQINDKHTLVARYGFARSDIRDAGIGGFNLISRGYHVENISQTAQITETAVLGKSAVNETRFQFSHLDADTAANDFTPGLQVLQSFNGGGASLGHSSDVRNSYEIQNYTSIARGTHSWRLGIRVRAETDTNRSPSNFGGTYTFGGGAAPLLDSSNQPVLDPSGQTVFAPITSIERYRRTLSLQRLGYSPALIRTLGGGATQFSISIGEPALSAGQVDVGIFAGDDWRLRSNLTLSLGLRYETQNHIDDRRDISPRLGIAWAPGGKSQGGRPKTVLRAGAGIFYDRFSLSNTMTGLRYNGIVQQQYVITNPDFFPAIPPLPSLSAFQAPQAMRAVSPALRAPYIVQSALSVEREMPFNTTVAVTYANSHGLHMLRSRNINAPLAGTYDPGVPGSGVFPLGKPGTLYLMESSGLYNQNQLIVNMNSRFSRNVSLSGSYVLNHALANTDGLGTYPAKPYDLTGEYGPAATDVDHRVTLSGSVNTGWSILLNPFLVLESGPPFDITVGRDLYGTTLFNARPGIPTNLNQPGLIQTKYGWLDPNPAEGEKTLSRNYGRGPGSVTVNLRLTKTINFGGHGEGGNTSSSRGPGSGPDPGRGGGIFNTGGGQGQSAPGSAGRRYSLSISMSARNLLNHTNPGPIIGNITSPLFGQANQPAGGAGGGGFSESANNRRLELQLRFNF
jgi:hypothetical protein